MSNCCIVIPCFNEEKRLDVAEFEQFFAQNDYDFCFVNDGSTDFTLKLIGKIQQNREDRIKIVDLERNSGKAEAVRQGILESLQWKPFDVIGYFDADFATPLAEIPYLYSFFDNQQIEMVIGSRVKLLGRKIERKPMRHILGRVFATVASLILKTSVYDTQCGAKLIKSSLVPQLFNKKFISKWLFDIEVFARIIQLKGLDDIPKRIIEAPLHTWIEKDNSKIKFTFFLIVPFELWKIHRAYRILKAKDLLLVKGK